MDELKIKDTEIFIHVGYPKTGSTFLRRKIYPNLEINRILTPSYEYLAEDENFKPEKYLNILAQEGEFADFKKTIISQVAFSGHADGKDVYDKYLIAERLFQTFPKAKIIFVIRNQLDYLLSSYSFKVIVRGMYRKSMSTWFKERYPEKLENQLQYDRLVKKYSDLFGKENILVLLYEEFREQPEMFLAKIIEFLGFSFIPEIDSERVNKSSKNYYLVLINRLINFPFSLTANFLVKRKIITSQHYSFLANQYFYFKNR